MSKKNKTNSNKVEIKTEQKEIKKDQEQINEDPIVVEKKQAKVRKAIILSKKNGKTLVQVGSTQLVVNEVRPENIGEIIEI